MKKTVYNLYSKSWPCNLYSNSKFPFGVSNHTITPRLSIGSDGPATLYIYLILMFIKPLWSSKEIIQAHTFFRPIWRGVLIKHDNERNYFKSKSMNLPKAIDIYHSMDHVMNIVTLACRTCLFFHHLWINWIVRGRARPGMEGRMSNGYLYPRNILKSGRY